jgi:hypothetical protein
MMFRFRQFFPAPAIWLTGISWLLMSSLAYATFVTGLSSVQVEKVLENYFPLNEYAAFARVSLHNPQVRLQKGEKSVVLIVPVIARVAGATEHRGHATIQVELTYKPHTGGLYFSRPRIQQFDMPSVDKKMSADLREIVDSMAQNSLPLVQVYRVKERDLNHSLAKSALKSSVIEDDRLRLVFGFN